METQPVQAEFVGGPWDGDQRTVMAGGYGYRIPLETPIMEGPLTMRIAIHIYARRDRLTRAGRVAFEYEGFK